MTQFGVRSLVGSGGGGEAIFTALKALCERGVHVCGGSWNNKGDCERRDPALDCCIGWRCFLQDALWEGFYKLGMYVCVCMLKITLNYMNYCVDICIYIWSQACHGIYVEITGQLEEVGSLLLPCGTQRSNLSHWAWLQVPFPHWTISQTEIRDFHGAGEMTSWLRALAKDPGSVPSTLMAASQLFVDPLQRIGCPLPTSPGTACLWHIYVHADTTLIYIK